MNFASKLLICFLCVVKFRYVVSGLKDLKYGHAEKGINMCFMHTKKNSQCAGNMHGNKQRVNRSLN